MPITLVLPLLLLLLPPAAASDNTALGPHVGDALPAFEAPDQAGAVRRFEDLRGPNGLLFVFYRSADW